MRPLFLALGAAALAAAQPTVAPTAEPVGSPRGRNLASYNIVNSFETGYRFADLRGNRGKYRSDVNYTNGLRLLGSFLGIHSREGQGRYFDELVLSTQGLGNDPYQSATFRIQKNRLYRYDALWRQNEYYNPALPISFGQHAANTLRRFQDHDLTLLPQSNLKFFLGYSRYSQTGPALSTIQLFDSRGDEFPLFAGVRRQRNEYRFGSEIRIAGVRLNWMHGWDNFKEDTPLSLSAPSAGNNAADRVTLDSLTRAEPYHGNSPYWRVALFNEGRNRYAVNGRFTYTAGRRAFVLDETSSGTARFGAANRQVLTYGNANRPVATGNLTLSLFPTQRLTLTNHTSLYNIRTQGDSYYRTLDNASLSTQLVNFRYLGIRTFANHTEVNYRFTAAIAMFAGYNYSTRRIRSVTSEAVPGFPADRLAAGQTSHLHSGALGLRIRPLRPLTFIIDAEIGRADRPIYPTSERNYQLLGARLQYKLRNFTFGAQARSNYNTNSVSLTAFSSRSRNYSTDASWSPRNWVSFDLSYAKLHLDTAGGIAYFAAGDLIDSERSLYISNLHHGNLAARFNLRNLADLSVGFSRVQDLGDGRTRIEGRGSSSALSAFQAAQTFPLTYQSPYARLSVRLHERLRWNVGYQYYGYREEFATAQDYRATTGYTSLLWSF